MYYQCAIQLSHNLNLLCMSHVFPYEGVNTQNTTHQLINSYALSLNAFLVFLPKRTPNKSALCCYIFALVGSKKCFGWNWTSALGSNITWILFCSSSSSQAQPCMMMITIKKPAEKQIIIIILLLLLLIIIIIPTNCALKTHQGGTTRIAVCS